MRKTEHAKDAPGQSLDGARDEVPEGAKPDPVEEDLAESLNNLPALPIGRTIDRSSGDNSNPDVEALEIGQPASAQPQIF